ncbi:hypothetical protein D3C85_1595910 [compost metagenome]
MQLQRQLTRQCGVVWVVRHLLLQLLNFRRVGSLFQQVNLREQTLIARVLILQWNGF